jgi:hypothetical protein
MVLVITIHDAGNVIYFVDSHNVINTLIDMLELHE